MTDEQMNTFKVIRIQTVGANQCSSSSEVPTKSKAWCPAFSEIALHSKWLGRVGLGKKL